MFIAIFLLFFTSVFTTCLYFLSKKENFTFKSGYLINVCGYRWLYLQDYIKKFLFHCYISYYLFILICSIFGLVFTGLVFFRIRFITFLLFFTLYSLKFFYDYEIYNDILKRKKIKSYLGIFYRFVMAVSSIFSIIVLSASIVLLILFLFLLPFLSNIEINHIILGVFFIFLIVLFFACIIINLEYIANTRGKSYLVESCNGVTNEDIDNFNKN